MSIFSRFKRNKQMTLEEYYSSEVYLQQLKQEAIDRWGKMYYELLDQYPAPRDKKIQNYIDKYKYLYGLACSATTKEEIRYVYRHSNPTPPRKPRNES